MQSASFSFSAILHGENKVVEMESPFGLGGNFHIFVDRYLIGQAVMQLSGWRVFFNTPERFNKSDEDFIIARIEEYLESQNG